MSPIDVILGLAGGLTLFLYAMSRLAAILSGIAATALLDSSSVTTILLIALIHAGALAASNARPPSSSARTSAPPSPARCAPSRSTASLQSTCSPVSPSPSCGGKPRGVFEDFLAGLENPLTGVIAGVAGTTLIQSSSALGIIIKLAAAHS
ncbi:MAG: hypothetical protein SFV54_13435 [Bryobacteraceae bacterium]|nr:hypothetical protein [Bryobacteraceae bacterium]